MIFFKVFLVIKWYKFVTTTDLQSQDYGLVIQLFLQV